MKIKRATLEDLAAGCGTSTASLRKVFNMIKSDVTMQDIRQLSSVGVPIMEGLAAVKNSSLTDVGKMIIAGEIKSGDIESAVNNLCNGMFYGMADKIQKSPFYDGRRI